MSVSDLIKIIYKYKIPIYTTIYYDTKTNNIALCNYVFYDEEKNNIILTDLPYTDYENLELLEKREGVYKIE